MIYINFNIRVPTWWKRFKSIKTWHGKTIFNHKCWEIQIIKGDNLFRFEFELNTKHDHAGVNLELGFIGYEIHFTFYDDRHWDYQNNCWENYD